MALLSAKFDSGIKALGKGRFRDNAFRPSLRFVGLLYQRKYLPLKFTRAAYRRYNLSPRSGDPGSGHAFLGSYQWKKLNGFKNEEGLPSTRTTKPFVYTGRSEQSGKRGKVTARAASSGTGHVEITIPAPALNFRPEGSKVNLGEEIRRVSQQEERELEEIMARDIEKRVNRILARA